MNTFFAIFQAVYKKNDTQNQKNAKVHKLPNLVSIKNKTGLQKMMLKYRFFSLQRLRLIYEQRFYDYAN